MKRLLKALLRLLAWVAALIVATALLIVGYGWLTGPPYDATLERQFPGRESDLQQLVLMARQDEHLDRIAPDFTWLDTDASWPRANVGLSYERWNRYRELFRHAGLPVGIENTAIDITGIESDSIDVIVFPIYTSGIVPAGSSKGYVYSEKPLSPIVASLDSMPRDLKPIYPSSTFYMAFKPFRKNWYIYRDEN
jgi:hypothetical protein